MEPARTDACLRLYVVTSGIPGAAGWPASRGKPASREQTPVEGMGERGAPAGACLEREPRLRSRQDKPGGDRL